MTLTDQQVAALLAPVHPGRVRQVRGNSHLEAWDIRRHLLRVFGWGGWDFTVVTVDCVNERSVWDEAHPLKGRHSVVYRVIGRLVIRDQDGRHLATFEDGAMGDGNNQPSLLDAHDFALKTAMSQCLKRCAVNLGDRFGLSLYGNTTDAVVGASLAHPQAKTTEHVEVTSAEGVSAGELDEPAATSTDPWADPITDHVWYTDWRDLTAAAKTDEDLRGRWAELVQAKKLGRISVKDADNAKAHWTEAARSLTATSDPGVNSAETPEKDTQDADHLPSQRGVPAPGSDPTADWPETAKPGAA